jgi:hypothetical protein
VLKTLLWGTTVAGLLPPSAPAPPPRGRASSGPQAAHASASSSARRAITRCCFIGKLILIFKALELTQLAIFRLRQSGTSFFSFAVFALIKRKNNKHMTEKYYAAAGKNAAL